MKTKGLIVFLLASLILSITWIVKNNTKQPEKKEISFFVSVPTSEYTSTHLPCVNVEIQGKKYISMLDLGFNSHASIKSEFLKEIPEKIFIKTKTMHGWKGKQYEENIYEIPKIKIGNMSISRLFLYEENPSFKEDSIIQSNKNEPSVDAQGKLGWKLFTKINLFLDLGNSKVMFCDGIGTLKSHGYPMDSFVKVPIHFDHDVIEIDGLGPNGPIRCFLDTGFTWNVLSTESKNGESMEEMALNPKNISTFSSLQIGGNDFGPISFHNFPIKMPFPIEVTLGMEFFREHQVFLDFANGYAYIAKYEANPNLQ